MNHPELIRKLVKGSLSEELVLLLVHIDGYLEKLGDQNIFSPLGITKAQFDVFNILEAFGGKAAVSTMSSHLLGSPPNLSGILKRMVKEGFIERVIDRDDRRAVVVQITGKGSEKYKKVRGLFSERVSKRLAKMSGGEVQSVLDALYLLYERIH